MLLKSLTSFATAVLLAIPASSALRSPNARRPTQRNIIDDKHNFKRQYFPANATGVKSFKTPTGVTIRYKEPGQDGVCETTPGVNSYSGYIDVASNVHVFFWFFESRSNPKTDPVTLWLNGGPGSDSLIGLFQELGPCRLTENLTSVLNPWSWNNVSNMLFLSQPVGTGFSYQEEAIGSINDYSGGFLNSSQANATGRFPILDPVDLGTIDTTDLAAMSAWHVIQGFMSGLPTLDAKLGGAKRDFNLFTESYGGHYGPTFYNYFQQQNALILNSTIPGYALNFNSLGIGNGIIDELIQAEYYPEFAVNNTYGIKAYNDTVYSYAKFANNMINGCKDQINFCRGAAAQINGGISADGSITYAATSNPSVADICAEAQVMCRDNVESPYYNYGGRGVYDIRHPYEDPTPPSFFIDYLNLPHVQNALGVNLNYTESNGDIYYAFQSTGDFASFNLIKDLEDVLNSGVRVSLYYGDADYICNWFGGEAVSLAVNYTHSDQFRKAGYEPFLYNGVEYGEVRQYGNFSFLRIYESGHEVPWYQPQASLALFNRTIHLENLATGATGWTNTSSTKGGLNATHTESAPFLPSTGTAAYIAYSSKIISEYDALDMTTPTAFPTIARRAY
nr:carboxypeptidase s1 like a [Quercus suber]